MHFTETAGITLPWAPLDSAFPTHEVERTDGQ